MESEKGGEGWRDRGKGIDMEGREIEIEVDR